jgi:pyruvate formate lyase activating enzyme
MSDKFVQPALLQQAAGEKVRCLTCERRCVIPEGERGWCGTRENRGGILHTLIYGAVSSLSSNPIEKKPLYHFHPGSVALTAGSYSCNFTCPWCQNWHISKRSPSGNRFIAPEEFVRQAQQQGCQGTSISFNEPTLSLEWSLDVFPLAHEAGLYNTYVTNGYMTVEALGLLIEADLDAMNVDVKGDSAAVRQYCQADVEVVWRNCQAARRAGVWVEITTLVIPGVNDASDVLRSIAERIVDDVGPDTPWHLSRYFPAYRFDRSPTPVSTLERAREIGTKARLRYVYLGNVPRHADENTICPECGTILVRRDGFRSSRSSLTPEGRCPRCGEAVPGAGW